LVLVIVAGDDEVRVVARASLPAEPWPALADGFLPLLEEGQRYLVLCYVADSVQADRAIAGAVALIGADNVIDALQVCAERFRRSGQQVWHTMKPPEPPWDKLGDVEHISREQVVAQVAGPERDVARSFGRSCAAAKRRLSAAQVDPMTVVEDLLAIGLSNPAALDDDAAATLLVCLGDCRVSEQIWQRFRHHNAAVYLRFFLNLVARAPRRYVGPLLGLTALSAWLVGDGTLQVCAIERGFRLNQADPLLQLAATIAKNCIPPQNWEQMLTRITADVTR
jgi:hypothetical protein